MKLGLPARLASPIYIYECDVFFVWNKTFPFGFIDPSDRHHPVIAIRISR